MSGWLFCADSAMNIYSMLAHGCIICLLVFLGGCQRIPGTQETAVATIPARALLIDTTAFPPGWTFHPCGTRCTQREGESSAERDFYGPHKPGHVLLEIARLAHPAAAQRTYDTYVDTAFRVRVPPNQQLVPPADDTFQSTDADESQFGCGVDETPICEALMRYGVYVVSFYADLDIGDGEGLTLTEILQIVQAVDRQASARLR